MSEATIHREGNRPTIEPVERTSLLDLIATWQLLDEDCILVTNNESEFVQVVELVVENWLAS